MARPRFDRFPAEQQDALLDAAQREFVTHGFAAASLNRILQAAGVSKGTMYYYFDGKEDLYADVIRRQLERFAASAGALPVPQASDADEFWATLTDYAQRMLGLLGRDPDTAALLRDSLAGAGSPSPDEAERQATQATMPWLLETMAEGQRIGAVRNDLADDLLLAVAFGMGRALDAWLISRPVDDADLPGVVTAVIEMMRRALAPRSQ